MRGQAMHGGPRRRQWAAALVTGLVVVALGGVAGADSSTTSTTAASTGVTRTPLGQASPLNAPGQTLYLQRVTIDAGARLVEHFHDGTQVARVIKGVLTYNVVSGAAAVTRKNGKTETANAPATITLNPGDSLVETAGLTHYGANNGKNKVVIELAALLRDGAPLATPTGTALTGTLLKITTNLDSESRTLHTVGTDRIYGWNRLLGTATVDGQPVSIEMLATVNYTKGSGPFSGLITFTFADGSTLGVQMQGTTVASADTTSAAFTSTLGVIVGSGRYATATGTGTFVGSRSAALGTSVAATFDLTLAGAK